MGDGCTRCAWVMDFFKKVKRWFRTRACPIFFFRKLKVRRIFFSHKLEVGGKKKPSESIGKKKVLGEWDRHCLFFYCISILARAMVAASRGSSRALSMCTTLSTSGRSCSTAVLEY